MGDTLLTLLHLCDSLFPIGAFAHSDGLETATSTGSIRTAADLNGWMDVTLACTLGRCDGPAVRIAWNGVSQSRLDEVLAVDAELDAIRPSSTLRQANRSMGSRLLNTWERLRPTAALRSVAAAVPEGGMTLPVAFGAVCAASQVSCRSAVEAFFYTRLAATISSAMRLMPIGQLEAHAVLTRSLAATPAAVERVLGSDDRPEAFTPALDIASMGQQYLPSRLFRS